VLLEINDSFNVGGEYFKAAFSNWITAFDLIILKIKSGNNTTIRV